MKTLVRNYKSIRKTIALILCVTIFSTIFPDSFLFTFANVSGDNNAEVEIQSEIEKIEPFIVGEIEELRDEYSKTYERSDGINVLVTKSEPIHYYDKEAEEWEEIDNTLILTEDEDGGTAYTNENKAFNTILSLKDGSASATIEEDGNTISFKLIDSNSKNVKETKESNDGKNNNNSNKNNKSDKNKNSKYGMTKEELIESLNEEQSEQGQLTYEEVYKDTDLVYDVTTKSLKESIVLKKKPNQKATYKYEIKSSGLKAKLNEDGSIMFSNGEKEVFFVPAPYMYDNNGIQSFDIETKLEEAKDGYILTIIPSNTWLKDKSRVYPVTIDPTIESVKVGNIYDTYTSSATPSKNYSTETQMHVGKYYENRYTGTVEYQSYINVLTLPAIPDGSYILSANLCLTQTESGEGISIGAYEITQGWSEIAVSPNYKPTTSSEIEDYYNTEDNVEESLVKIDITRLYNKWYSGITPNYGVKLAELSEEVSLYDSFYTTFYTSNCSDVTKRPYIVVEYQSGDSIKEDSLTQIDLGNAGTLYVNDYSGNLTIKRSDIGYDGNIMPVNINFIYNYNNVKNNFIGVNQTDYAYGAGWVTNYSWKLQYVKRTVENETIDYFMLYSEDGSIIYFDRKINDEDIDSSTNMSEVFVDSKGRGYSIKVTKGSYANYTLQEIIDTSGNRCYFDLTGRIVKIVGDYPSTKNVTATSGLSTGTFEAGVIRIDYFEQSKGSNYYNSRRIKQITDGAGRKYVFNYNVAAILESISYYGTGSTELNKVKYEYNPSYTSQSRVVYKDNSEAKYYYSMYYDKYKMTFAQANDIYGMNMGYVGTSNRVDFLIELGIDDDEHRYIDYDYQVGQTTITEGYTTVVKQFDAYGNLVSTRDNTGYAVFGEYENTDKSSTLISTSDLRKTSTNLLMDIRCATGAAAATDNAYISLGNCYKLSAGGSINAYGYLYEAGTYTVSAYVKTKDVNNGVYLDIAGTNISVVEPSKVITGTNEYTRIQMKVKLTGTVNANTSSMTYYGNSTVYVKNSGTSGTAWVEGFQIEKDDIGKYNLLKNPTFVSHYFGATNWTFNTNTMGYNGYITYVDMYGSNPSGCRDVRIIGSTYEQRYYKQNVSVTGKSGETFSFGGWGKATAASKKDDRSFSIQAKVIRAANVNKSDFPEDKVYTIDFNPYTMDWQYALSELTTEYDYSGIEVSIHYDYQVGNAYFNAITLCKEPLYNNYSFGDNGNLISIDEVYAIANAQSSDTTENQSESESEEVVDTTTVKDEYGRITKSEDKGVTYLTSYDKFSNVLSESKTDGSKTISSSSVFSSDGNYKTSETDENGSTTTYNYDLQTGLLKSVVNALGNTTNYSYDTMDRIKSITMNVTGLSGASSLNVSYTYDEGGRIKTITHGGTTFTLEYDGLKNLKSISSPQGKLITYNYKFMESGYNLSSITYGNGQGINYEYDKWGVLTSESQNGKKLFEYKYSIEGESAAVFDYVNNIKTEYTEDSNGNSIVTKTGINGNGYYYQYTTSSGEKEYKTTDESGKEITVNHTEETLKETVVIGKTYETIYIKDEDGNDIGYRYVVNSDDENALSSKVYDKFDRLISENFGLCEVDEDGRVISSVPYNILNLSYTYKDLSSSQSTNMLSSIKYTNKRGFNRTISYGYNALGFITSYNNGKKAQSVTYEYDEAGQLVRVNYPGDKSVVYVYDNGGNRVSEKVYDYTTGNLGEVKKTNTYGYNSTYKDLLVSVNGSTITYDGIGNPLKYYNGESFTWTRGRMLASAVTKNGQVCSYTYDENGYRISKTVGSTTFKYTYRDDKLVYQTDGSTSLYFRYDSDGGVIGFRYTSGGVDTEFYYLKNQEGDVLGILDETGNVVVEYEYDAWGNVVSESSNVYVVNGIDIGSVLKSVNPLRYRGYYYDSESGFYYLQSRYYDAGTGRFINGDVAEILGVSGNNILGANLFVYCNNNPVNYSDPNGLFSVIDDAIVGGVLLTILVVGIVSTFISKPEFQSAWRSFCCMVGTFVANIWNGFKYLIVSETQKIAKALMGSMTKVATTLRNARNVEYFAAVEVKFGRAKKDSSYIPIKPLQYWQAIAIVRAGGSVFATSKQAAYRCAKAAGNGCEPTKPERHSSLQYGNMGYFWHYHTGKRTGGHVFYL